MLDAVGFASREPTTEPTVRKPNWRLFLQVFIPLMLIAGAWSLSTPIDGSPDEHRHLIYAYALATGQVTSSSTTYVVPDRIGLNRSACYAFAPEESAACDRLSTQSGSETITTATSANNYPRLYYRIAGWPLRWLPSDAGVYAARLVGGALSCTLLSLAFMSARRLRSPWLGLGLLLCVTPMVFFLIGSFNPHGLELAGSAAFIVALLALLVNPQTAGRMAKTTALLAVPAMVLARPNGFIWPVALAGLILLAAADPRRSVARLSARFRGLLAAVTFATMAFALWWQLSKGARDTGAGVIGPAADRFDSPLAAFTQILTRTQTFPGDWIGTFGWLDTRVTTATLLIWFGTIGGLVLLGLTLRPGRQLWVAGAAVLMSLVLTLGVDAYYRSTLGVTVAQGRYVLPFAMLAVCLVTLNMTGITVVQARLPGWVATFWVLGSMVALAESVRRYTVGVSLRSTSGTWDTPVPVPLIALVGGLGMIYLAVLASRNGDRT